MINSLLLIYVCTYREEVCSRAQELKIEVNDAPVIHFSAVLGVLAAPRLLPGIPTTALERWKMAALIRDKCSTRRRSPAFWGPRPQTWGGRSVWSSTLYSDSWHSFTVLTAEY